MTIKITIPAPITIVGQLVRAGDWRKVTGSKRRERSGVGAGFGVASFAGGGRFVGSSDGGRFVASSAGGRATADSLALSFWSAPGAATC